MQPSHYSQPKMSYWAAPGMIHFVKDTGPPEPVTVALIISIVCKYYKQSFDMLKNRTRKREVVAARQVAMFLLKTHTVLSLKQIGLVFGGFDHTTIIYSIQIIKDQLGARIPNPIKTDIISITRLLKAGLKQK